jgi:hypothetical protein
VVRTDWVFLTDLFDYDLNKLNKMQTQDKRMIALLGDMIDPNFREKLINPPAVEVKKDSEVAMSRPVYKKAPLVPSYSTHRPKLIRFSTMQ